MRFLNPTGQPGDVVVDAQVRKLYLSPPDVGPEERRALIDAFDSGWIAPVGPDLDTFERELTDYADAAACVALASGTAALHLALLGVDVRAGDEVVVQSATFAASAFAVVHAGATPIFCDSEWSSWCMDPHVLRDLLEERAAVDRLPAAVMPVDLYGSIADYGAILEMCAEFGVPVVRDGAEALGSVSAAGGVGALGVPTAVSFNGNKVITTSSGGALFGDPDTVDRARHLATQARQPVLHYEHVDIGYNYRLSNLLAAVGRAQLRSIERKIERRAAISAQYQELLPAVEWCPVAHTERSNQWLAVGLLPVGCDPLEICRRMNDRGIEARPAWKPMHEQPVFADREYRRGDDVASALFRRGICLPSGSSMHDDDVRRVAAALDALVAVASA